jgi:hypothetical protein
LHVYKIAFSEQKKGCIPFYMLSFKLAFVIRNLSYKKQSKNFLHYNNFRAFQNFLLTTNFSCIAKFSLYYKILASLQNFSCASKIFEFHKNQLFPALRNFYNSKNFLLHSKKPAFPCISNSFQKFFPTQINTTHFQQQQSDQSRILDRLAGEKWKTMSGEADKKRPLSVSTKRLDLDGATDPFWWCCSLGGNPFGALNCLASHGFLCAISSDLNSPRLWSGSVEFELVLICGDCLWRILGSWKYIANAVNTVNLWA